MSIHIHEPGSFHDNRAVFDVAFMLRERGKRRHAERIFEMLERHIEETGERRSRELLLPQVRAQLAILRGAAVADLVKRKDRTRQLPRWRFRFSRTAAIAIYYAAVIGLVVSITFDGIWITIPP